MDVAAALYNTDYIRDVHLFAECSDCHTVKTVAFWYLELDKLRLTMCEGVDFKSGRHVENSGSFFCCLKLRVDNHCKSELFTKISGFLTVIGGAYSGYGSTVAYTLCDGTAQQVELVRIGYCDNEIGGCDSCLLLDAVACAVADYAHDIVHAGCSLKLLCVFIYQGYIMTFFCKLLGKSYADFSTADNYYTQTFFGCSIF